MATGPAEDAESIRGTREEPAPNDGSPDLHQPHDALISAATGDPERALDLLRSLLPRSIVEELADELPVALDPQMLSEELQRFRADRVWRVKLRPNRDNRRYLYVVVEFQSTIDQSIAWRTARYSFEIAEREASADTPTGQTRPALVIALVVYHGNSRWTAPKRIVDYLYARRKFRPLINRFDYTLRDLARMRPSARAGRGDLRAVFQALVCAYCEEMGVEQVAEILRQMPESSDLAVRLLVYMYRGLRCDSESIRNAVRIAWPRRGKEMLGLAEAELVREHRIKAKAEGRAEGRVEGRVEGRAEGRAELVLHAIEHRFGEVSGRERSRIRKASDAQHEEWLNAMMDGKSLKTILGEDEPE